MVYLLLRPILISCCTSVMSKKKIKKKGKKCIYTNISNVIISKYQIIDQPKNLEQRIGNRKQFVEYLNVTYLFGLFSFDIKF